MSPPPHQKPTVLLVPGCWHTLDCFAPLLQLFAKHGYPVDGINHKTNDTASHGTDNDTSDDVDNLQRKLEELLDDGKQVIVLCHSYGGRVAGGAVEGLGYRERSLAGKAGGVISVVFMCAFVLRKGRTLQDVVNEDVEAGHGPPHWMEVDENGVSKVTDPIYIFYSELSEDEQQKNIAKLVDNCIRCFGSPQTYEPWHEIPVMYILCTEDKAIPLASQNRMVETMKLAAEVPTVTIECGHFPFLTHPEKVVEAVVQAHHAAV